MVRSSISPLLPGHCLLMMGTALSQLLASGDGEQHANHAILRRYLDTNNRIITVGMKYFWNG